MKKVLIVGSIANFDLLMANALNRNGLKCIVVRSREAGLPNMDDLPTSLTYLNAGDVVMSKGHFWLYRLALRCDHVISFTGILPWMLREWWIPALLFKFTPIVHFSTGSDMMELVHEDSFAGRVYRSIVWKSRSCFFFPYPEMFKSALKIGRPFHSCLRFPYFLPSPNPAAIDGPIVYFHPSHLDWGVSDNKRGRKSTKGNDRFLKAFFRAIEQGANVRCIILDRGADRHLARQMIDARGLSDRFEWLPNLTQKEFSATVDRCDVVVDQFVVGGFGGIAIESMSKAKPVMMYIDEPTVSLCYGRKPPIFNCQTEDEIFATIMENQDRAKLQEMGLRASEWAVSNHDDPQDFICFAHDLKGDTSQIYGVKDKHHVVIPRDFSKISYWESE